MKKPRQHSDVWRSCLNASKVIKKSKLKLENPKMETNSFRLDGLDTHSNATRLDFFSSNISHLNPQRTTLWMELFGFTKCNSCSDSLVNALQTKLSGFTMNCIRLDGLLNAHRRSILSSLVLSVNERSSEQGLLENMRRLVVWTSPNALVH